MQRLVITWLTDPDSRTTYTSTPQPLLDEADYFEIGIDKRGDEQFVHATGHDAEGDAVSEHFVPLRLVRSVSAVAIDGPEPSVEDDPDAQRFDEDDEPF